MECLRGPLCIPSLFSLLGQSEQVIRLLYCSGLCFFLHEGELCLDSPFLGASHHMEEGNDPGATFRLCERMSQVASTGLPRAFLSSGWAQFQAAYPDI